MVSICEIDDCGKASVGQFKRTEAEAEDWPNKNMPIDLCRLHSKNHSMVKCELIIFENKLIIKTVELEKYIGSIAELSRKYNINRDTLKYRLTVQKMSVEQAIKLLPYESKRKTA